MAYKKEIKKGSLYDLTGDMIELMELMEDPEADEETLQKALDGLMTAFDKKFDGYMKVFKELEAKEVALKAEADRIKARKATFKNRKDRIKETILLAMLATDRKKIETDLFSATVKDTAGKVVIDDEDDVPDEFWIPQPAELDLKGIKEYLKENKNTEWAHIEPGKSVAFK